MLPVPSSSLLLSNGWQMLASEKGSLPTPQAADAEDGWMDATVPGTAFATLKEAGLSDVQAQKPLHSQDSWWRCEIDGQGLYSLQFDGVATLAEVWLGSQLIKRSHSMFIPFACDITLNGPTSLHLCCRALVDTLERKLPRARWRTRLVATAGLRGVRTTLLGQVLSFMPPLDTVGPWRAIRLVDQSERVISEGSIRAELDASDRGILHVTLRVPSALDVQIACCGIRSELHSGEDGWFSGCLVIENVAPWWPHTHGPSALHAITITVDGVEFPYGKTGFRRIEQDAGKDGRGFGLMVNGQPVFSRGACWVSADAEGLKSGEAVYRPLLERAKAAGINLIRMSGVGAYEDTAFFELCDALGIMVWQDFMFANFDYPIDDPAFAEDVTAEADALLSRTQRSPSLVVFCGGSEMLQQAAMMGLAPDKCRSALIDDHLPSAVRRWRPDAIYVENSPFGTPMPFGTSNGVTHYFGVGAYMRPIEDVRRSDVRFAAECLAFSNLLRPESQQSLLGEAMPGDLDWSRFVPRDAGTSWDFEDVRDFYLHASSGLDPQTLKITDPGLYYDLSCEIVSELVTRTYWEWRRSGSDCNGAIVWLFQDLKPGAGWGILDVSGRPKSIYYALKRVWQPLHLGLTDEGLEGLGIHVVNEGPEAKIVDIELSCWRSDGTLVLTRSSCLRLAAHSEQTLSATALIGAFFDLTYAYRFGPLSHDGVTVKLLDGIDKSLISTAHYYPPQAAYHTPVALEANLCRGEGPTFVLDIMTAVPVRGLFIYVPGWCPSDDGFDLSPGARVRIELTPEPGQTIPPAGTVRSRGQCLAAF